MWKWFVCDEVPDAEIGYRAIVDGEGGTIINPSPTGEDNARLIATAPEMLRALQRLTHPMADDDDMEYALAVIRRAKGEA